MTFFKITLVSAFAAISAASESTDFTQAPSEPDFTGEESIECMNLVTEYFYHATTAFNHAQVYDDLYATMLGEVLADMSSNNVKLVGEDTVDGNKAFRNWILNDWYLEHPWSTDVPEFSADMEAKFGADGEQITAVEQLEEAVWSLIYYRENYWLEWLVQNDEAEYPHDLFDECPAESKATG